MHERDSDADTGGNEKVSTSPAYGVLVNADALRHQMHLRGLTAAEVARLSRERGQRVSAATISHALNGHRIQPGKLRAIAAVLGSVEPLPGIEALVQVELVRRPGTSQLEASNATRQA